MSKRRRVTVVPQRDKFYQDWHIKQTQAAANVDEEWTIQCPRPLYTPPAGRYYAIEIHSIEWYFILEEHDGQRLRSHLALTYSPRTGHDPFLTGPGDPENLFWANFLNNDDTGSALSAWRQDSHRNRAVFTDDHGFGKLVVGPNIYMQIGTTHQETPTAIGLKIQYTFTTVSCSDYVEELAAQLTS